MPTVADFMKRARKRTKDSNENTSQRFREILGIVRAHDLKGGLTPEKAVSLLQDLGTTFVKLGQIASTHPDVLPVEYCEAFGALRTHVAPLPFDEVRAQVEGELGHPLEELFAEFDEKAVGSASVAQVHRAVLPDGTVVAVKVQRPGVVEKVTGDLAIMERLVDMYELVSRGQGGLSVKELVEEMVRTSTEELDFLNEAANLDRFWANNEAREGVTSPRCYREYTTSAILTEDFAPYPAAEKVDKLGISEEERERLAYLIAHNYMQQIMDDGFYHADPHAGNVLILPDGAGIEWIDFGMMGTMTTSQRDTLEELVTAMVKGNAYSLKRSVLKIATPTGPVDHAALLEMCERMTDQFVSVDLESFDTGALMTTMTKSLQDSGFDVDPFLVSLGRGLVTLEGTIHHISPKLNIMDVLMDYLRSSFSVDRVKQRARRIASQGMESVEAMATLPTKAAEVLDMMQKGQVRVGMELSANERFGREMKGAAYLIAIAFVVLAFVVGACILGASGMPPLVNGVSAVGIVGLVVGIVAVIWLYAKGRKYFK